LNKAGVAIRRDFDSLSAGTVSIMKNKLVAWVLVSAFIGLLAVVLSGCDTRNGSHQARSSAGVSVADCKRVIRVADGADRKINISFGFQQRYGPVYINAKKMLDSGAIGQVREVHVQFLKYALTGDEPVPPIPKNDKEKMEQWKLWRATFGEVIVETYCHNLDAVNWFMNGHPVKALGSGGRTGPPARPMMSMQAFIADTSYPLRFARKAYSGVTYSRINRPRPSRSPAAAFSCN